MKETIQVHDFLDSNSKSCDYDDCVLVIVTIGECGLAYPIDKEQFVSPPKKGDILMVNLENYESGGNIEWI